jgi:hypothetical protein
MAHRSTCGEGEKHRSRMRGKRKSKGDRDAEHAGPDHHRGVEVQAIDRETKLEDHPHSYHPVN